MSAVEFELKFRSPIGRSRFIRQRLESLYLPDPVFPGGTVWTLYLDTPSFDLLREKIDGDCDKRKVRVRWYDGSSRAYAEIKYRFGASRDKLRVETTVPPERLTSGHLDARDLADLLEPLRATAGRLPAPLHPMITIRFQRRRFVDPVTGVRVSIDDEIAVVAVNRGFIRGWRPNPLPFAVIETKGAAARLPGSLSGILGLGGRRASISKYAECYRRLCRT